MTDTITYSVPGIHCAHCGMSIREEVSEVEGVEAIRALLELRAKEARVLKGGEEVLVPVRFRHRAICDRLPPVATTGLHNGSIPRCPL